MNLHTARYCTEADGVSGFVGPGEWFTENVMQRQKTLATFEPVAQQLDKDFTAALLMHENPSTGKCLRDGPGCRQAQLQSLWNDWLQTAAG